MEFPTPQVEPVETEAIIVKADEVDEAGADISTISPTDTSESEFNARIESRRAQDALSSGSPKQLANAVGSPPKSSSRPLLRREGSTSAPPQQPPSRAPPPAQEESSNATDSLSLLQLRKLVSDLPKLEPTAYAYHYAETRSFPEELEEWFSYTEEERYVLLRAKDSFEDEWEHPQGLEWLDSEEEERENFIVGAINILDSPEITARVKGLQCITYIALGVWGDTAGMDCEDDHLDLLPEDKIWLESQSTKPKSQLQWITNGTISLCKHGLVERLLDILKRLVESEQSVSPLYPLLQIPLRATPH